MVVNFCFLSAVLPNAEDLSEWLTGSSDNVYKENWRPSDERIGIMEWNGRAVNLKWKSNDTERIRLILILLYNKNYPRSRDKEKLIIFQKARTKLLLQLHTN